MIKTKRIYLRKFTMDEADLLFQLDGDADVMKYITLGIPRTMDEVIEKSMPRILKSYQGKKDFGIFLLKFQKFLFLSSVPFEI